MSDENAPEEPPKKTHLLGLSKRTHAIIFAVSVAIEIAIVIVFGASLWQGAKWAWAWLAGG